MINCKNCKHCNALPALGYGFCVHHNIPRKLPDFCIWFEEREAGPNGPCTKLEETTACVEEK